MDKENIYTRLTNGKHAVLNSNEVALLFSVESMVSMSSKRYYSNTTGEDIYVATRDGQLLCIKSKDKTKRKFTGVITPRNNNFSIITEYTIDAKMASDYINSMEHTDELDSLLNSTSMRVKELVMLITELKKQLKETEYESFSRRQYKVPLVFDISKSDITANNNRSLEDGIYLPSYDILLSHASSPKKHPYVLSDTSTSTLFTKHMRNKTPTHSLVIDIVDNNDTISPRYIYQFGKAVKLIPRKVEDQESGVWVYSTAPLVDPISGAEIDNSYSSPMRYDFEDADKELELFRTAEEALHSGSVELKNKITTETHRKDKHEYELKIKQLEMQARENDKHHEQVKQNMELETITYKRNIDIEKMELERQKKEIENLTASHKAALSIRTANASEWSDTAKLVGVAVTALASIFATVIAIRK